MAQVGWVIIFVIGPWETPVVRGLLYVLFVLHETNQIQSRADGIKK